ncbi:hypothetical protein C1637_16480 [Chryseobacterium lactis]|uniref:Uncharacterized protein n=2 Tax=Bacteroidota TaxID=976 RepID=A0A4U9VLE1_9SPHI|nr:hypothetical protein EG342_20320 [Chryseobacterium lactis]AZB04472.1 hypothetical protein EG341_11195 [Chryseobacterium lactis]OJV51137.1 MAG: hypothetical protein BGO31_02845 [Bacteroidetes bacterium 43-16]PNW12641.1 hypothetical protein C1637_16480 [Chryseobacterium lactis]VTR46382.1 Uncharacterised protein [Sphingobacterium thalpophilum]
MLNIESLSQFKTIPIEEIKTGDFVINLGEVVEIDKFPNHIDLIILRLNEKYVIKFSLETLIVIK